MKIFYVSKHITVPTIHLKATKTGCMLQRSLLNKKINKSFEPRLSAVNIVDCGPETNEQLYLLSIIIVIGTAV
jgi:hypothetical protein